MVSIWCLNQKIRWILQGLGLVQTPWPNTGCIKQRNARKSAFFNKNIKRLIILHLAKAVPNQTIFYVIWSASLQKNYFFSGVFPMWVISNRRRREKEKVNENNAAWTRPTSLSSTTAGGACKPPGKKKKRSHLDQKSVKTMASYATTETAWTQKKLKSQCKQWPATLPSKVLNIY